MCPAGSSQKCAEVLGVWSAPGKEQVSWQRRACGPSPVLPPQIEGRDVTWTPPHLLRNPDMNGAGFVEPPMEIISIERDHRAPDAFLVAAGQPVLPIGLLPLSEADRNEGCGGRVDAHRVGRATVVILLCLLSRVAAGTQLPHSRTGRYKAHSSAAVRLAIVAMHPDTAARPHRHARHTGSVCKQAAH